MTLFHGKLPEHKSRAISRLEDPMTVSLPETKSPARRVRTYKVPRMRRPEKLAGSAESSCKLCATYAQLRLCEVVRTAVPDIPVKCGPCMRREMRGQDTASSAPSRGSAEASEPNTMPRHRPVMKKQPLEVAAGNEQMVLQMLVDVQRSPKRVRRAPARLLEV